MNEGGANAAEAVITGCGLVSPLGAGPEESWARLNGLAPVLVDETTFAPFSVYPTVAFDPSLYVPKPADRRVMGPTMLAGVYAAGKALESAGIADDEALLATTRLIATAATGERDDALDDRFLQRGVEGEPVEAGLNGLLTNGLRPTLYLAQLPNLFAANVAIVHGVAGSSLTLVGEEAAGVEAVRLAVEAIEHGDSELLLVGAAANGCRRDRLFTIRAGGMLGEGCSSSVWDRRTSGVRLGSAGAFMVIESREHAVRRGATVRARLRSVQHDLSSRQPGEARRVGQRHWDVIRGAVRGKALAILSGACGAGEITCEERAFLDRVLAQQGDCPLRGTATLIGHSFEAAFLVNLILGVWCLERGGVFPPSAGDPDAPLDSSDPLSQVLVTCWGHAQGEALALVECAHAA